uniref:C-type lectin domain-containing protein n=1 Tax=Lates calcarifer TaxID=8187 RepID=A0A4W6G6A2_LATCA
MSSGSPLSLSQLNNRSISLKQTQKHCRENYMDLASVSNQAENQALQQMINESGLSLVWIGLFRDEWKWSDQSTSSLRYWESSQPNNDGACTLYNPSAKAWYDRGCTDGHPFYCYKGKKLSTYLM